MSHLNDAFATQTTKRDYDAMRGVHEKRPIAIIENEMLVVQSTISGNNNVVHIVRHSLLSLNTSIMISMSFDSLKSIHTDRFQRYFWFYANLIAYFV